MVKSDFATVAVPEIELEIPANSQKGGVNFVHYTFGIIILKILGNVKRAQYFCSHHYSGRHSGADHRWPGSGPAGEAPHPPGGGRADRRLHPEGREAEQAGRAISPGEFLTRIPFPHMPFFLFFHSFTSCLL